MAAIQPSSLPNLAAFVLIAVMIALASRKQVKLNELYGRTYLALDAWLLLRFLRPNLLLWFKLGPGERSAIAYVISIAVNLAIAFVCTNWLTFIAAFCRRYDWTSGRKKLAAHLPVLIVLVFAPTNPLHHLFYTAADLENPRLFGPVYFVFLATAFFVGLMPMLWLVDLVRDRQGKTYRRQAIVIIVSTLIPAFGSLVEVVVPGNVTLLREFGLTPICFALTAIFVCYALLRMGFLDVLPMAIREVFLAMSDAVLVLDSGGRLVQANPAAQNVFTGMMPGENIQYRAPQIGLRLASYAEIGPEEFEADLNGSVYWVRIVQIRSGSDVAGRLLILTDVTRRKRAENELRQREQRFRSLVQNALDVISIFESDGTIRYESPSVAKILGYSPEELIGRNVYDFMSPDEIASVKALLTEKLGVPGSTISFEATFRHKDGSWRILATTGANLLADPSVRGLVFNSRDITERKAADNQIRQYTAELERSNRRLESFAYVASHDLQEPLRKVLAFGDRLSSRYADLLGDDGIDYLTRMQKAASRMRMLIDDLLSFSRVSRLAQPFVEVDMSEIVTGVLSDLEIPLEQSDARVEVSQLGNIAADPTQMRQLMQNLISNALKFRKKDEPALIRIYSRRAGPSGDKFVLTVEDNGIGFDEKHAERIFEPFQRLHGKDEYEGTGIGLSLCRTIAERHGGNIEVKSIPGQGTCFTITLRANPDSITPLNVGPSAQDYGAHSGPSRNGSLSNGS